MSHTTPEEIRQRIVAARKAHPTWGPKKLAVILLRANPTLTLSALSTIAAILKREGLVEPRGPRQRTPQSAFPMAAATAPNIVWCADFEGKFKVGDAYCHPLTITDACSRFVLRSTPLKSESSTLSRAVFEDAFREFGLPLRMRSDNGRPFASTSVGGLSALSIWWLKLGILPQRIAPGCPLDAARLFCECGCVEGAKPERVDFFISYTGADVAWLKWIDAWLRARGHSTRCQHYDFGWGESFVGAIQQALVGAEQVLCLVSAQYLQSSWCNEEAQAALKDRKLRPILIEACKLQGLYGTRSYVSLVGLEQEAAEARLAEEVSALMDGRARPSGLQPFPGGASPAKPSGMQPRFPGRAHEVFSLPLPRNPHFTGRGLVLEGLHQRLSTAAPQVITQAIKGLGGVGKSQTALEYAYRYGAEYDGVWWLRAEDAATLLADFLALAPRLGLPAPLNLEPAAEQQLKAAVRDQLRAAGLKLLLIFDNVTAEADVQDYVPQAGSACALLTSRSPNFRYATAVDLDVLPEEDAVELLLQRAGGSADGPAERAAAGLIARRLGGLPLALEQAAAYVQESHSSLIEYRRWLQRQGLALLARGAEDADFTATVSTTWLRNFEALEEAEPAAAQLLQICAYLAPEDIRLRDFVSARKQLPEPLQSTLEDELAPAELKRQLLRYSLVRATGDFLQVHRLVQEVMRARQAEESEPLAAALALLQALRPGDAQDVRHHPELARLLPHCQAACSHPGAERAAPHAVAALCSDIGEYHYRRAEFGQAEPLMRRALKIDQTALGKEHPNVAIDLNNLGLLLQDTNRTEEAEPLLRRALKIDRASFGDVHPNVARDLSNLALLLKRTNRFKDAEPLMLRALAISEAGSARNHPTVATALNNLASLLRATNRLEEAEPFMRRALDIDQTAFGEEHPNVAIRLNNLALLLQDTNRLEETEPLMRRALKISEAALGEGHPNVANRLNNLAALLKDTNRLEEAEPLMRRALDIYEASLGKDQPQVAMALNNLAQLLKDTDRHKEAEPLMRRALKISEAALGDEHPNVATALNNLAALLKDTNRLEEAEPLMRRALKIWEESLPAGHPQIEEARRNLAALSGQG